MRNIFKTTIIAFSFIFSASAFAEIEGTISSKIEVEVHGMVCAFCATGVKNRFSKFESIKEVNVDLDTMKVNLELKADATLTEDEIKAAIKESGYEYKGAKYE